MEIDRWEKIEAAFHELRGLPETERPVRISALQKTDPEIAQEVESLLSSAEGDDHILSRPMFDAGMGLLSCETSADELLPDTIGIYEIRELIGRGGMGAVYMANDTRLDRRVALKVLTAKVAEDTGSVERFRHEAKAASKFTHPNIAHIYDFGEADGKYFLAMEYVEGHTLRKLLEDGPFSLDRAVAVAVQVADALAAAHRNGFIHRDIKPENVVITDDEKAKVLDFGLAKRIRSSAAESTLDPTNTVPGMVLGTTPYMSPEQIRGDEVDGRTDIWALGVLLYEMLSGRRPFDGENIADTMSSILKEEPVDYPSIEQDHGTSITHILKRCLAKKASARFESARDLGFMIEAIGSDHDPTLTARLNIPRDTGNQPVYGRTQKRLIWSGVLILLAAALLVGVYRNTDLLRLNATGDPQPLFQQVTFQRGTIWSARFAPDGQTMVYSATWNGNPINIFRSRQSSPESRSFDMPNHKLLAISSKGELAILRPRSYLYQFIHHGTLARLAIEGGAPREVADDVEDADWAPDGERLAVVRMLQGRDRLEYPTGTLLFETAGYISNPRFSPDGKFIAFLQHDKQWDNRGTVSIVDTAGNTKKLTDEFSGIEGLAWYPKTGEVWFTASRNGEAYALYAVSLDGITRLVERSPSNLMLFDISKDNRVLLARAIQFTDIYGSTPADHTERNLSWLQLVGISDLSESGDSFVFTHFGAGSGKNYSTYIRPTDGGPAVRLGDGRALALSPDGRYIAAKINVPEELVLHPVKAGEVIHIPKGAIEHYDRAVWFSDNKRLLFNANETGKGRRCYVQSIDSTEIKPVTPEGIAGTILSPDDKWLVATNVERKNIRINIETGEIKPIENLDPADDVIRWDGTGKGLFVYRPLAFPLRIFKLDPDTGKRELLREISPSDLSGIMGNPYVFMTGDGKNYVYGLRRYLYDLYLTEGLN